MTDKYDTEQMVFKGQRVTWIRPCTLEQLIDLKTKYPSARLVVGNTEIGNNYPSK